MALQIGQIEAGESKLMNQSSKQFLRQMAAVQLFAFAPSAFAYLDPSTGSMILSAIVGVFATVGLAVKTYWYKLKSFFTGNKSGAKFEPPDAAPDSSEISADNRPD
jgi:hypothetical protein